MREGCYRLLDLLLVCQLLPRIGLIVLIKGFLASAQPVRDFSGRQQARERLDCHGNDGTGAGLSWY